MASTSCPFSPQWAVLAHILCLGCQLFNASFIFRSLRVHWTLRKQIIFYSYKLSSKCGKIWKAHPSPLLSVPQAALDISPGSGVLWALQVRQQQHRVLAVLLQTPGGFISSPHRIMELWNSCWAGKGPLGWVQQPPCLPAVCVCLSWGLWGQSLPALGDLSHTLESQSFGNEVAVIIINNKLKYYK